MRFYPSTAKIGRQCIIKELTEERSVGVARFLYHVKGYLIQQFFNFSSGQILNKASRKTPQNRRVVNVFLRLCPLLCEYNCSSFTNWHLLFPQVSFDFQINVWGICFPFSKTRISIVKYHYKKYILVYYFGDNTTICVFRRIKTLFYVDQLVN